jgi:hypothetical protein
MVKKKPVKTTKRKTRSKTKPAKKTRNSRGNTVDDMTNTIGKVAIVGATSIMALGVAGGIANAMRR